MLNIVLLEPEIAGNVGNIIRTCAAYNAQLHMVRPYGFFFSKTDPKIKRDCANYIEKVKIMEYDSFSDFIKNVKKGDKIFYLSRYGSNKFNKPFLKEKNNDVYLCFGKESSGIDKDILKKNIDKTIRIPASINVRSLNVANCVSILSFLYAKDNNFKGLEVTEPFKKGVLK